SGMISLATAGVTANAQTFDMSSAACDNSAPCPPNFIAHTLTADLTLTLVLLKVFLFVLVCCCGCGCLLSVEYLFGFSKGMFKQNNMSLLLFVLVCSFSFNFAP
ncbi:unnamed protein product, partial [Polarella glacialis]